MARVDDLSDLIAYVRELIADPAGASQSFSDEQIARELDLKSVLLGVDETEQLTSDASGLIYVSSSPFWEKGENGTSIALEDADGTALSPNTDNILAGEFYFLTDPGSAYIVSGRRHRPHQAAISLVRKLIATLRAEVRRIKSASGAEIELTASASKDGLDGRISNLYALISQLRSDDPTLPAASATSSYIGYSYRTDEVW